MQIILENDSNAIDTACNALQDGKLIAFATDTVFGIACDASNEKAVDDLFATKQRNTNKPIAIFVASITQAQDILHFNDKATALAKQYMPGKLTMILEKKANNKLAKNLNNQDNSLGFRIVDNDFIQQLLAQFGGILAVSSANISKQKPATTTQDVTDNFSHSTLALVIKPQHQNPSSEVSTVIRVTHDDVHVLRKGAIDIA